MSGVEKMMQNAGVEKIKLAYPDNFEPFYPDFTAEKQLELIKWLADSEGISIRYQSGKYIVYDAYSGTIYFDTLEEAIAQFINLLWQDLTEQERTQIADILRG